MKFKIENNETGNSITVKTSETEICFSNEYETFIAKGKFPSEKINEFNKIIKETITEELNEQLLGESDSFSTAISIFEKTMKNKKIYSIKYKELNPHIEEELEKEIIKEILNNIIKSSLYKDGITIVIETYNHKILHSYTKKKEK